MNTLRRNIPIHPEVGGPDIWRSAYNAWAEHYNECPKCNAEPDWMHPGMPQIRTTDPENPLLWTEKTINGVKCWVAWAADSEKVLCPMGLMIFRKWERISLNVTPKLS